MLKSKYLLFFFFFSLTSYYSQSNTMPVFDTISFNLAYDKTSSIRLYHLNDSVKQINPSTNRITNVKLISDLKEIIELVNYLKIDSTYVSSSKVSQSNDLKALFINFDIQGDELTFLLTLNNNDPNTFVIQEFYFMNEAKFYTFKNSAKISKLLKLLIENYTSYNSFDRLWEDPNEIETEAIIEAE